MVQNQNLSIVEKFKRALARKLSLEQIVLFGSRAKGVFSENSDFDLIVVSKDFEGVPRHLRAKTVYPLWPNDQPVEIICLTPNELRRRIEHPVRGIVSEALATGIQV